MLRRWGKDCLLVVSAVCFFLSCKLVQPDNLAFGIWVWFHRFPLPWNRHTSNPQWRRGTGLSRKTHRRCKWEFVDLVSFALAFPYDFFGNRFLRRLWFFLKSEFLREKKNRVDFFFIWIQKIVMGCIWRGEGATQKMLIEISADRTYWLQTSESWFQMTPFFDTSRVTRLYRERIWFWRQPKWRRIFFQEISNFWRLVLSAIVQEAIINFIW